MDFSRENDFILPPQTGPMDSERLEVWVGTDAGAGTRCISALRSMVRPICARAHVSNFDTGKTAKLTGKKLAAWWDSGVEISLNDLSFVQLDALLDGTRLAFSLLLREDGVRFDARLANSPNLPSHARVLEFFADDFVRAADAAQAWTSHSSTPSADRQPSGDAFRPERYVYCPYERPKHPGWYNIPLEPSLRLYIGRPLFESLRARDASLMARLLSTPGWLTIGDLDHELVEFLNPLLLSYDGGPNCVRLYPTKEAFAAAPDGWSDTLHITSTPEAEPVGTKFYTNITLVGADATVLVNWLLERGTPAYVELSALGIVLFDADADGRANHDELARAMSELLGCTVIVVTNHDDDLLTLEAFDKGASVDTYISSPDFFAEETSDVDVPTGGHRLAALFGVDADAVEEALRSGYVEEHNRHEALIELFALPAAAVWYNFDSFANGTAPEPSAPGASFIAIP